MKAVLFVTFDVSDTDWNGETFAAVMEELRESIGARLPEHSPTVVAAISGKADRAIATMAEVLAAP
jgi:hypothetical protein